MDALINQKSYPSKLLLFGEYTVFVGSQSLAIPYSAFNLRFKKNGRNNFSDLIKSFHRHLKTIDFSTWQVKFNAEAYRQSFENGLFFDSNIPIGYGLGSSGALTAAIFDCFFDVLPGFDKSDLNTLKEILSAMESFFHGKSSGTDPLISYLNHPVIGDSASNIKKIDLNKAVFDPFDIYLIDSGMKRSTGDFVKIYHKKMGVSAGFRKRISRIKELNDIIIDQFKLPVGDFNNGKIFNELSSLQFDTFREMIPQELLSYWKWSLQNKDQIIKLCGAGGGGYFFLFSSDPDHFKRRFPNAAMLKTSF